MLTKQCTKCKEIKPNHQFASNKMGKYGTYSVCKACKKTVNRMKFYDLTEEQYNELLKKQNNKCAICSEELKPKHAIDHCHKFWHTRGILCYPCNIGLGAFKDDPKIIKRAIAYLQLPR